MIDRDVIHAVKRALSSPAQVARTLGLKVQQKGGGGVLVRCPVHEERTGSCSLFVRDGVLGWRCHGCGAAGDVLQLFAAVHGLDVRRDFRETLAAAAELAGLHEDASAVRDGTPAPERRRPVEVPPPEPPRNYPAEREVADLWASCIPAADDVEASGVLVARRIDPDVVARLDAARVLRSDTHASRIPNWARFKGNHAVSRPWTATGHRLLMPVFDADGRMRSVRAWLVSGGEGVPKRLPPAGCRTSGLVLASAEGVRMLRGDTLPREVVVTEGEPDTLVRAVLNPEAAILGVLSGSWHEGFARRVPFDADVLLLTHVDDAGEKYAREVAMSVQGKANVYRWQGAA